MNCVVLIYTCHGVNYSYINRNYFWLDDVLPSERDMNNFFYVFGANCSSKGVTLWGYMQGSPWRRDGTWYEQDGTERPAMTWLRNFVGGQVNDEGVSPEPG